MWTNNNDNTMSYHSASGLDYNPHNSIDNHSYALPFANSTNTNMTALSLSINGYNCSG